MTEPATLFAYLDYWAGERPGKTALYDGSARYTYKEYARAVASVRDHLAARGVGPGQPVAVSVPKATALPLAYLGAAAAGAIPFPVDVKTGRRAWRDIVTRFSPVALLASGGAAPPADSGLSVIFVEDVLKKDGAPAGVVAAHAGPDDIFYLNLTSGVSGQPKAVGATHANVIANARAALAGLGLGEDDVHLVTFAAHAHPHECFARALVAGGSAAFVESLLPRSILSAVEEFRATALMGVPPMFRSLLALAGEFDTSSLRVAEAGGMGTGAKLLADFRAAFGVPLRRVWGSTETSGIAFLAGEDDPEGSLGWPLPGYDAAAWDDAGREVAAGETGELVIRGPACAKGYWRRGRIEPADGVYLRTGDLVRREADGRFMFVDRLEGLMKVAGEKVYAAEIERVLRGHAAVAEAAVVPVEDEIRGQVPVAYVVPYPHLELTAGELTDFVQQRLSPIKRPRRITVVASLPLIPSGKIDKRRLGTETKGPSADLAAIDGELLRLLNRRAELLRAFQVDLNPEVLERDLGRLAQANAGPLHDETVEEVFRKLNELMGY